MMCRIKKSVVLALAAVGFVFAQNPPLWQNLYPAYNGLAFGAGKFVAVSNDGLVRTTSDGAEWFQPFKQSEAEGNTRRVYAVAFGDGRFVALQNRSTYLQSVDGFAWAEIPAGVSSDWKYLTFGGFDGNRVVAVDDEGWTALWEGDEVIERNADIGTLYHAAYGVGRYVVVGDRGIKHSGDAKGWASAGISTAVSVVTFGNDKFVALSRNGGSAYTSADGSSWTTASAGGVPAGMADMVFGNGKFVAVGAAGKGCVSSDGASWSASSGLNEADDFKAVKFGNNIFLALGAKGSVYKSSDGAAWTELAGSSVMSYKQIVYGIGKFVAVGDSGVSVSTNGKDWKRKGGAKNLRGVAANANRFVAVGEGGTIISSLDGENWDNHSVANGPNFSSVAFGNNTFMAGGWWPNAGITEVAAAIYTSADGRNWVEVSLNPNDWPSMQYPVSLCFGSGLFLAAVGSTTGSLANKIIKTCDGSGANIGRYWSNVSSLPSAADGHSMVSAVYAGDRFVAVGTNATAGAVVLNSTDAANWTAIAIPQEVKGVRAATFAKGAYIAAADSGNIYAYLENRWILQGKATNRNLSTIYSGNEIVLAAGANGAMLYSSAPPTSVRHTLTPRAAASSKGGVMSLERSRLAPAVTLSFTPKSAGAIEVYSLSGRRIYRVRLDAGERSVRLPERAMSSGSVIVRYTGGGRVASQRFQFVR